MGDLLFHPGLKRYNLHCSIANINSMHGSITLFGTSLGCAGLADNDVNRFVYAQNDLATEHRKWRRMTSSWHPKIVTVRSNTGSNSETQTLNILVGEHVAIGGWSTVTLVKLDGTEGDQLVWKRARQPLGFKVSFPDIAHRTFALLMR